MQWHGGWGESCHARHFIPTSSSWLSLIERFFREITDTQIRRGSFDNIGELIDSITAFIDNHNAAPKLFIWNASVQDILDKVRRARASLDGVASG